MSKLKYKYARANRVHDFLVDRRIRFTQPSVFNDPFEMLQFKLDQAERATPQMLESVATGTIEILRHATNPTEVIKAALRLPQNILISIFSPFFAPFQTTAQYRGEEDPDEIKERIRKTLEAADEKYGILSLAGSEDNLLMWAHYGDEHKGAVVAIDVEDPEFIGGYGTRQAVQEMEDVDYQPERLMLPADEKVLMGHFFLKSVAWKYEREYRIVRLLADGEKLDGRPSRHGTKPSGRERHPVYVFDLPPSCLQTLIFGVRFDENERNVTRDEVIEWVRANPQLDHLTLAQARLDDNKFRLLIEEIENRSGAAGAGNRVPSAA